MLPPEKQEIFRKMWLEGSTYGEISRILKIREALIPFYAKLLGLPPRRWSPTNKKISDDVLKTAIELWKEGLTYREIAGRLGLPPSTIRTYLNALGLKRKGFTRCVEISREELEKLINESLTDDEIAGRYGTKPWCIYKLRRRYGLRRIGGASPRRERVEKVEEEAGKRERRHLRIRDPRIYEISEKLEKEGFVVIADVRRIYGRKSSNNRFNRRILSLLREILGDRVTLLKLRWLSTRNHAVFRTRIGSRIIIYLKGREEDVARYLLSKMVGRDVPRVSVKRVLERNEAPPEVIERVLALLESEKQYRQ